MPAERNFPSCLSVYRYMALRLADVACLPAGGTSRTRDIARSCCPFDENLRPPHHQSTRPTFWIHDSPSDGLGSWPGATPMVLSSMLTSTRSPQALRSGGVRYRGLSPVPSLAPGCVERCSHAAPPQLQHAAVWIQRVYPGHHQEISKEGSDHVIGVM